MNDDRQNIKRDSMPYQIQPLTFAGAMSYLETKNNECYM